MQECHVNNHKNRNEFIYLYSMENKGSKKMFNENHLKGWHMVVNPTQFEVILVPKKGHENKFMDEKKLCWITLENIAHGLEPITLDQHQH